MLMLEILGWVVIGSTVGYFFVDIPRAHRIGVIPAMFIGAIGAVAGGFLGYAISGVSMLEGETNLASVVSALICALVTMAVAVTYRRFRPAHHEPIQHGV